MAGMDATTIARLNQINREFYRIAAEDFDETRGESWPGWERLLPYLRAPLSVVLDVGCGNGRFGMFLQENIVGAQILAPLQPMIVYHGVDSNTTLLRHAHATLQDLPGLTITLEVRDIVENPPDAGAY